MCSIVVALVFRLLYWIIYCTGLIIEKKGVVLIVVVFVPSSYCLIHCFIIITLVVFAVGPSLSSLVGSKDKGITQSTITEKKE